MRAWQVVDAGEPENVLRRLEADSPEPGPGQLRIQVTAAGIGLPDVLMCRGVYPLTPPLPFTPGQEVVGVVNAVGDGVSVALGTRVMAVTMFYVGRGSFADECLVAADMAFPVPEGLTDAEAAGFWIPHMTAWAGLVDRGQVDPGEVVAVLGASGGSGSAAVLLAKALGAKVIAVAGGAEKVEFCRALDADEAIDHRAGPIAPRLRELTDGRGVDLVFDPVGGDAAEDAVTGLARGGRLLLTGFASGRWPTVPAHELVVTNTSLVGVIAAGYRRAELDSMHARLSELIGSGQLRSLVTEAVAFDELPARLQEMADRSVIGKRVVVWGD